MAIAAVSIVPSTMNVLVVDEDQCVRQLCSEVAAQLGMRVTAVATAQEAMDVLETSNIDILITGLKLRESNGLDLIDQVQTRHCEVAVIPLTGYGIIHSAVSASRLGAVDYVTKPFCIDDLSSRLHRAA